MTNKCSCSDNCCTNTKLIFSCSGGCNTGYLADMVARNLMQKEVGTMGCLSGLGASIESFVKSAKSAGENIVVDGCKISCGKKIFNKLKIPCLQFIMTDYEIEKGKTEITEDIIEKISEDIKIKVKNILENIKNC